MKYLAFIFAFFCFALAPPLEAQSDVTLNNDIEWDASAGAAGYQVKVQTSINGPFWPSNTDGNVVHDNGLSTTFDLALALTGAPQAIYKVMIRAVDVGGTNPTVFVTISVNYIGISPPQNPRVVMLFIHYVETPLLEFMREYALRPDGDNTILAA